MTTMVPAMRGQFGSTEYFLVTMPAKELTEKLVIPKDLDEWKGMTIEDKFQREVNYLRVKKHIAPYLANDPDRFFGSFIVDMFHAEDVKFEPIRDVLKDIPKLYQKAGEAFGFLYLDGNEVLVPLDGQHRLAALKFAITGKDEKQKDISGIDANFEVAKDLCSLILVKHDNDKARKIFNKVNRYAKATSKADNLITADDDIVAVITREEVADKVIHERLVNTKSNTLPASAIEFTTLSVIYEGTKIVLEDEIGKKINTEILPSEADQKLYRITASEFWEDICQKIKLISLALHDASEAGDAKRKEIRKDFVIGKPIVQLALVDAIVRLRFENEDATRLSLSDVCNRINKVDWSVSNSLWQHVLMKGNKVVVGKQAARFAGKFIAYLLGATLEEPEITALEESYQNLQLTSEKKKSLPSPLF